MIYLDNNATTKVDPQVLEAMLPYFKEEYANPSSMYEFSVKSSNAIAESRGKIKDFLGAKNEKEIIFTSCGSESANMAITIKREGYGQVEPNHLSAPRDGQPAVKLQCIKA